MAGSNRLGLDRTVTGSSVSLFRTGSLGLEPLTWTRPACLLPGAGRARLSRLMNRLDPDQNRPVPAWLTTLSVTPKGGGLMV